MLRLKINHQFACHGEAGCQREKYKCVRVRCHLSHKVAKFPLLLIAPQVRDAELQGYHQSYQTNQLCAPIKCQWKTLSEGARFLKCDVILEVPGNRNPHYLKILKLFNDDYSAKLYILLLL